MTEEARKYISDISMSIEKIEQFTEGVDTFDLYIKDLKTQSAVERQLGIIGEAMGKLRKLGEIKLEHDNKIIGFRNRLIHAYDSIDNAIIWAILKRHIPLLKEKIASLEK